MSADINSVVLVGRLTRNAELKYTASGAAICNFSIASNRRIKKGDEWVDQASFFDLTLWNKQAEGLSKYLTKGTQVAIQGYLQQNRWEKDGQIMTKVQIGVDNIQLIGGKREGQQSAPHKPAEERSQGYNDYPPNDEDDIPF